MPGMHMSEIAPFRLLDVPQADLADLAARLDRTRRPDEPPGAGWYYGIPLARVRELAARWRTACDRRAQKARINAFPQFTTEIDGTDVRFAHVRSPEPGVLPLITTHGRPSTIAGFPGVVGPLTDPRARRRHALPAHRHGRFLVQAAQGERRAGRSSRSVFRSAGRGGVRARSGPAGEASRGARVRRRPLDGVRSWRTLSRR